MSNFCLVIFYLKILEIEVSVGSKNLEFFKFLAIDISCQLKEKIIGEQKLKKTQQKLLKCFKLCVENASNRRFSRVNNCPYTFHQYR